MFCMFKSFFHQLYFNYNVLPEKSLMMSFPSEAVFPCTLWTYLGSHIYVEKEKYHMLNEEFSKYKDFTNTLNSFTIAF